jgi:Zn-dependent peptidase ImmA (M78 family)
LTSGIPGVILFRVKTAVSIPEPIYSEAEQLAHELGVSRSALYTRALEALLRERLEERLLNQINAVCERVDTSIDPKLVRMQAQAIRRTRRERSR